MTITTVDGLLAGLQKPYTWFKHVAAFEAAGNMHSLLIAPGMPGTGVAPGPGIAGSILTGAYPGQPPYVNPAGGLKSYLARATCDANTNGKLYLCDRLWHNSGVVVTQTTVQTVNSPEWPARDNNGTINGEGVLIGLECYTATTNGTAVAASSIGYTNSDGVAGRQGFFASVATSVGLVWPITAAVGTFVPFMLQQADLGVKSVQSVTLSSSYGAGAIGLVAYRPICSMEVNIANGGVQLDWSQTGMPEAYNDTSLWLLFKPITAAACMIWGQIQFAHG